MQTKLRGHTTLLKPYFSYFCSHCILHLHCPTWALPSSIYPCPAKTIPFVHPVSERGLVVGTSGSGRRYNAVTAACSHRTEGEGGRERGRASLAPSLSLSLSLTPLRVVGCRPRSWERKQSRGPLEKKQQLPAKEAERSGGGGS